MFKNKKKLLVATLVLLTILCLCSCGKENEYGVDTSKTYQDDREIVASQNESDFVLGTSGGTVQLYDKTGKILDTLSLSKSSKSDFIYCEDSGEIYSKNLLSKEEFNCVLYAVDRADGKLYIIQNKGNKLKIFDTISLKASKKITDIKAYNGTFFYMVKGNGINAKDFTVAKTDNVPNALSYTTQVGIQRRGKTYSYIYINNLVDTYVDAMGIKSKLDNADISNLNVPAIKKETIIIPYDVSSWTVTNNSVAFCAKDIYGSYDLNTDIITFCYGTTSSIEMAYRPGRYSSIFALNQMGNITSKSILFEIDTDELTIDSAIEFNEEVPLGMYLDNSSNVLYIIYKLDNKATYGKLKIYDLNKNKEINNITFDFVPTDVKGHNGMYYVMNSYESFMVYGENSSKKYEQMSKYVKDVNASSLLLCNIYKKDYFTYDKQGRYIDDEGHLLDYRGNIINVKNQKINKYGQVLDNYGRAINANGELVDRYNNIIDENGVIIKYTQQSDGYYRSSKGVIVDETGKAMIRQEDGTYIKDVEEIPSLEWHYDENGNIVINQDYLDKYPDAASWIDKDTGKITKGQYVDTTNADEKESKADDSTVERLIDKLIFWK